MKREFIMNTINKYNIPNSLKICTFNTIGFGLSSINSGFGKRLKNYKFVLRFLFISPFCMIGFVNNSVICLNSSNKDILLKIDYYCKIVSGLKTGNFLIGCKNQEMLNKIINKLLTKYAIYGPSMPIKFEPIVPIERPVWRKHVGYVSIACKLMTKKVMAAQNLTIIVENVE